VNIAYHSWRPCSHPERTWLPRRLSDGPSTQTSPYNTIGLGLVVAEEGEGLAIKASASASTGRLRILACSRHLGKR
jgi:hypothetical protein